jgi:uncharacterized protein (DUF2235 family)
MSKTIVFCADGTWNGPGNTDPLHDGCTPQLTNVCKLFGWLQGALNRPWGSAEMEKVLLDAEGTSTQVAKYIHGVGDSQAVLDKVAGGAFGVGVVARIARGYTYVSRNYTAGDSIVIVGFSRGAYTARALAGLIASEGLLKPELATDAADKYDNAVEAWYRYRHGSDTTLVQRILDGITEFHDIWQHFNECHLTDADFVPVSGLAAVAVWDTVGALGIPLYTGDGTRRDLFNFCDTRLSAKVGLGLHAVSLDEQRKTFEPTLWDDAPNVTQAVFPGGHCDVGGGYPEHSLSDVPLLWFIDRLQHPNVGLKFDLNPPTTVTPDACGCAHAEWNKPPWQVLGAAPRSLRQGLMIHDAVRRRMNGGLVQPEPPPVPAAAYAPVNLPA